jgi:tripartite-type tricarboxylate transporter receptor subunit TctC
MNRRDWLMGITSGALGLHAPAWSKACAAPTRLVVGFAAGGGIDALARAITQPLGQAMQCTVLVDNRPGAGGALAASQVANAQADGNTLLFGDTALLVGQHANKSARYNIDKQFAPVAQVARLPLVLAAHSSVAARTPGEFIEMLKQAPGKYSYGSAGVATLHHLGGELLQQSTGLSWTHVAYKGGAPAVQDLMGGQIPFAISSIPAVLPHVRSGKIHLIAVMSAQRVAQLPDVPAMGEVIAGFDATPSSFLLAPVKTTQERQAELATATLQALATPAVQSALQAQGAIPAPLTGNALQDWLQGEDRRWARVVSKAGITLD